MKRSTFLKLTAGTIGVVTLTGAYTYFVEPFWLEFVHRELPIKNLPPSLHGKVLMQISDIHAGDEFPLQYIKDSFIKAKAFDPDIVVYTGDFTTYHRPKQYTQLQDVMTEVVQGKLGTVGIFGNHDYGHNWKYPGVADRKQQICRDAGIQVLRNESKNIEGLNIIGIDDYWGTNFNPSAIMPRGNWNQANLVLCHNPDVMDLDVWNGYGDWVLAGHTHGGQVKPPFLDPPTIPVENKRYTSGAFDFEDGRKLYINRALGNVLHIRFNARPEITIFRMVAV